MKYNVTLNGKVYEVEVERGEAILVNVSDYAPPAPAAAPAPVAAPVAAPAPAAPTAAVSGDAIKAPMPGTILDIKVGAGSMVKAGQIVLILEAMKMENEIVAHRDGKVAQILVSKGSSVESGAALMTLE